MGEESVVVEQQNGFFGKICFGVLGLRLLILRVLLHSMQRTELLVQLHQAGLQKVLYICTSYLGLCSFTIGVDHASSLPHSPKMQP